MATSCISVSVSAPGVFGYGAATATTATGKDHGVLVSRQTGRVVLSSTAAICAQSASVSSGAAAALVGVAGLPLSAVVGGSRTRRNAAIAARAADLEPGLDEAVEDLTVGDESAPPSSPPPPPPGTKLYVGNLPWSVHSKQLAEYFQEVGNVELVEVIYDRETQKSRGFAFVTMSTVEDAQRAIEQLDGQDLEGRTVKVNFPAARDGPRRSERPPRREFGSGGGGGGGGGSGSFGSENKLFVGNLAWGVDDVSLESLFQEYGKVVKAEVVYDRQTGRSRGFGFVVLSSANEVNHAISNLDGKEFDKRLLRVNLAGDKPPPREPREY